MFPLLFSSGPTFSRTFCLLYCEKNCRSEKNRQVKNGGAEGGDWCERESGKEAGEEPAKVGWTRGKNGRQTVDEES